MNSIVVAKDFQGICAICGRPREAEHHLIFGNGFHKIADADGLTIPICNDCHTLASKLSCRIHDNSMAESLSKMLGQLAWEKNFYQHTNAIFLTEDPARELFRNRYGRSYL